MFTFSNVNCIAICIFKCECYYNLHFQIKCEYYYILVPEYYDLLESCLNHGLGQD